MIMDVYGFVEILVLLLRVLEIDGQFLSCTFAGMLAGKHSVKVKEEFKIRWRSEK